MVIPIDLYFLFNLTTDYFLVWAVGAWTGTEVRPWRCLGAAAAGAAYAAAAILPGLAWLAHPLISVAAGAMMVRVAYGYGGLHRFGRLVGSLFLVYFASAGAALALSAAGPRDGWAGRGIYWLRHRNLVPAAIIAAAVLGRLLVPQLVARWTRRRRTVLLCLRLAERELAVRALVDTGNHLADPFSGRPVIVASAPTLAPLLPPEVAALYGRPEDPDPERAALALSSTPLADRVRLVPYRSLGQAAGLLLGLRIEADDGERGGAHRRRPAVLALTARPLDPDGVYQAICPPELIEGGNRP